MARTAAFPIVAALSYSGTSAPSRPTWRSKAYSAICLSEMLMPGNLTYLNQQPLTIPAGKSMVQSNFACDLPGTEAQQVVARYDQITQISMTIEPARARDARAENGECVNSVPPPRSIKRMTPIRCSLSGSQARNSSTERL